MRPGTQPAAHTPLRTRPHCIPVLPCRLRGTWRQVPARNESDSQPWSLAQYKRHRLPPNPWKSTTASPSAASRHWTKLLLLLFTSLPARWKRPVRPSRRAPPASHRTTTLTTHRRHARRATLPPPSLPRASSQPASPRAAHQARPAHPALKDVTPRRQFYTACVNVKCPPVTVSHHGQPGSASCGNRGEHL